VWHAAAKIAAMTGGRRPVRDPPRRSRCIPDPLDSAL
jgi:hypothetical protein